ncbi:hypothetical protein FRC04_011582 [Tulasnella sp. 424]|nr:hypothetical protein FRC04_011582 [Tulasnella sp. 424]KAG8964167.1 hypothetical protein FRC05_004268 [Tulasnella sp. 425]
MARHSVRANDLTLEDETLTPPAPTGQLDNSQTIISAYQVRASRLQARLLATLDALDTLQHERTSELQALEDANARLTRHNTRLQQQLKLVEEENDDMKEAVSALVDKVDELNGVEFLSRSRISVNAFIEPLEQDDGNNIEPPLTSRPGALDHFSPTLFKALAEELAKEKEAHELTRNDAATRIAVLQAQLARRDAELEAHVAPDSVSLHGSTPPEVPAITKSQARSILEEAAKQNRKLEAEVKRLSQQVGIYYDGRMYICMLTMPLQLGKMRTNEPFHPAHFNVLGSQAGDVSLPHQRVLADLDNQIRSAEVDAVELGTERMRLAYLDQISPENHLAVEFDQVLLIEDECLRLRQVEHDLTSELRALRQQKSTNEARLFAEIEELRRQALGSETPRTVKGTSTVQPTHPLVKVPSIPPPYIPPPYVSPAQPAIHGPSPSTTRPQTPPSHLYNNPLPSPPSSTHTVKPRTRRGSDSLARELLTAMEDVREKDRMLSRLKRELEELKARMLDERGPLAIVAGILFQSTPPSQKHASPLKTNVAIITRTGTNPAAPLFTSSKTHVPIATKKKTVDAPQKADGAESITWNPKRRLDRVNSYD